MDPNHVLVIRKIMKYLSKYLHSMSKTVIVNINTKEDFNKYLKPCPKCGFKVAENIPICWKCGFYLE